MHTCSTYIHTCIDTHTICTYVHVSIHTNPLTVTIQQKPEIWHNRKLKEDRMIILWHIFHC
ncbi:hypothetical protein Hanom_Chr07g00615201 [Helianthus anomalus]